MGGRGASSGGALSTGKSNNAVRGIALLQGAVERARTEQLMQAYSALQQKDIRSMSNEEKMVRGVATDELVKRGKLVYDSKTGDYHKYNGGGQVIYDEGAERSYRVSSIETESYGDEPIRVANAEYYYGGKWHPVKNMTIRGELARRARQRK